MSRVGRAILLSVGIALGVGALVFVTINGHPVQIDLYFYEPIQAPMWLFVAICLLLGWAVPQLLGMGYWFRCHRERTQLKRRIRDLEREVLDLRNIPLDIEKNKPASDVPKPPKPVVPRHVELLPVRSPKLLANKPVEPNGDVEELDIEVQSD